VKYISPQIKTFEEQLEERFPKIEWRLPIRMAAPQGTGLGCRFCIARYGIAARQIPALPQNIAEFHAHMRDNHPVLPSVAHVAQKEAISHPDATTRNSTKPSKSQ
jgi:hypothetical protein